ncbi:MAG TPA: hypothetical protein VFJ30_02730, partial [Phycisphaerae bacterium]|nr:hypothetical protein [Phycisphaerae bacterium]
MAKKPRKRRRIVLIIVGLLALTAIFLHLPVPPPKLQVGPETTVLLGPLREDGTVDYAAALEAEASRGVTAENNAAIPLLRVLGPEIIEDPLVRAEALKKLGLSSLPEDGD